MTIARVAQVAGLMKWNEVDPYEWFDHEISDYMAFDGHLTAEGTLALIHHLLKTHEIDLMPPASDGHYYVETAERPEYSDVRGFKGATLEEALIAAVIALAGEKV